MFGKKSLSNDEKMSRKMALKGLRKTATDSMDSDLKGLKKVTVASDSPKGLALGLDKAKQLTEGMSPEGEHEDMAAEEAEEAGEADESLEAPEHDKLATMAAQCEDMSVEELEAAMHLLAQAKEKKLLSH